MNEFDRRIKQKVQSYLNENISFSEKEVTNIQEKLQKRKSPFNYPYIFVLSILSIVLFIAIMPVIQQKSNLEFSTVPYSSKNANYKDEPAKRELHNAKAEEPLKEKPSKEGAAQDEKNHKEDKRTETEEEKEAIFLEIIAKYNKLRDSKIDHDGNEFFELDKSTGYNYGHRVIDFNNMQEFSSQYSHFATTNAITKMFDFLVETDKGLYLVPTEHKLIPFEYDKDYYLRKIDEHKYQITQTTQSSFGEHVYFTLWFEFTKIDGKWLITDWEIQ